MLKAAQIRQRYIYMYVHISNQMDEKLLNAFPQSEEWMHLHA